MATVVQYSEFGSPDVLQVVEIPTPTAPADGLVVEVRAAGVNPIDWKLRKGIRPSDAITEPRRLGSDAAGVITDVGSDVDGWVVGDEVVIRNGSGTYASHVIVTPQQITRKPASLDFLQAAAIGVPVGTAYQALRSLGVQAGETLLIHGGSGAVGQAAIQFARDWDVTVVATGGESSQGRLAELGAVPVVYGPGLADRIRAAAPQGIDRVLDAAGTDEALEASFELVEDRSRIGTIVVGARAAELGIRAWSGGNPIPLTEEEQQLRADSIDVVAELAAQGKFEFQLGTVYPLAQAAEAHRESESGHPQGKILLVP